MRRRHGDSNETERLGRIRGGESNTQGDDDGSTCSATKPSTTKPKFELIPYSTPFVLHWNFIRNTPRKPITRYILVVSLKILLMLAFYASMFWLVSFAPRSHNPIAKPPKISDLHRVFLEEMNKVILVNEKLLTELEKIKFALKEAQKNPCLGTTHSSSSHVLETSENVRMSGSTGYDFMS